MKVKVVVHDICTKEELDNLINDAQGFIEFEKTLLSDGTYDVFAVMIFPKCSMFRYLALQKYARAKKDKVKVVKL